MSSDLLIHEKTAGQLEKFLKKPAHALLITGMPGSGKVYLAQAAAADLLLLKSLADLDNYPYFSRLSIPEGKQEIPIESVRETLKLLRLKTPGDQQVRRVVLIEDAQALSPEAQNALLKILEEPSADTVFLLTVASAQNIAPTIVSRAQQLAVHPITLDSAKSRYKDEYPAADIESNWRLSGGAAGLLVALLKDSKEHPLKNSVQEVKKLLGMNTYERLLAMDALAKDKAELYIFLDAAGRVLGALQQSAAGRGQAILSSRKLVNRLQAALQANANPRLVALELALNLKV